jgi:hypothetical protein
MTVIEDIRKSVTGSTPVLAVVGATDLAVERVRKVAGDTAAFQAEVETRVTKLQEEVEKTVSAIDPAWLQHLITKALDPKAIQAGAQQVPALAVSRALEVAGQVESRYESLAARGKSLVGRVQSQKATQDLVSQGKATLSRSRAAVTTARKAVDDTTAAARGAVTIGRREAKEAVTEVEQAVAGTEKAVARTTRGTRSAVKRTSTTARNRTATTRTSVKGAATSARKTATKAVDAAQAAAEKVGD